MWKTVDQMTVDEAESEMYHLEDYFRSCVEIQNGISSKDVIRYRRCCDKVEAAGRYVSRVL